MWVWTGELTEFSVEWSLIGTAKVSAELSHLSSPFRENTSPFVVNKVANP